MANNEIILFDNFLTAAYKDLVDEEKLFNKFPQNFEQMKIQDDLDLNNLYLLSKLKTKDLSNINKTKQNVPKNMSENDHPFSILDDFEEFYKKFTEMEEIKEVVSDKEESKSPYFTISLDFEKQLAYKCIEEEEKLVLFENKQNLKNKKEKKIKKKSKSKIFKNLILPKQNSPKKFYKPYQHKKKSKFLIDKKEKSFTMRNKIKIIRYSNQKSEDSFSPGFGNSSNHSQESSQTSRKDFSPSNEKNEKKNKKNEKKNKKNGENKEKYKKNKLEIEISNYQERFTNICDSFVFKFKTKKYFIAPNGKKKRVKKKRKFKPDDIRKKIKARFHKTFKNIINENLKKAGSKLLFDFLPQCFIGNVSKKTNSRCLELTYKELLSNNFIDEINKDDYPNRKVDQNKLKKNIEVLKYLEMNPEICKRSGFDLIKDRKYKDILNIYFTSGQFENSIIQLKEEKESPEYIQEYINRARTYVSFYSNAKNNDDQKEKNKNDDEEEEEEEKEKEKKEY